MKKLLLFSFLFMSIFARAIEFQVSSGASGIAESDNISFSGTNTHSGVESFSNTVNISSPTGSNAQFNTSVYISSQAAGRFVFDCSSPIDLYNTIIFKLGSGRRMYFESPIGNWEMYAANPTGTAYWYKTWVYGTSCEETIRNDTPFIFSHEYVDDLTIADNVVRANQRFECVGISTFSAQMYVASSTILSSGNQETGYIGVYINNASAPNASVSVNFKNVMINTPSSITLTSTSASGVTSAPTVQNISKYGFTASFVGDTGEGDYWYGTYTTAGN